MTALVPAIAGALLVAGLIGLIVGLRKTPPPAPAPRTHRRATARPAGRCDAAAPGCCSLAGAVAGLLVAAADRVVDRRARPAGRGGRAARCC